MSELERLEKGMRVAQESADRLRGDIMVMREQLVTLKDSSKKTLAQAQASEARAAALEKQIGEIKMKASAIGLFAGGSTVGIAEVIKFIMHG